MRARFNLANPLEQNAVERITRAKIKAVDLYHHQCDAGRILQRLRVACAVILRRILLERSMRSTVAAIGYLFYVLKSVVKDQLHELNLDPISRNERFVHEMRM
jgi:hypothetical protein